MNNIFDGSGIKKAVLFAQELNGVGGEERLLLEEANFIKKRGIETTILTFNFEKEVLFGGSYKADIKQIGIKKPYKSMWLKLIQRIRNIYALRKELHRIKPDIIISSASWDCIYLYLATMLTPFSYVTHIHGTIFWFLEDLSKYALIHRKVFNEIRNSVAGHRVFIPAKPPKRGLVRMMLKEVYAIAVFVAVRRAKKIFVLSEQMKWEVGKLYGKEAIALKGAFPPEIFNYVPKQDIRKKLGLGDKKIVLNVNRLDPRKRVDLLIQAFNLVSQRYSDAVLLIGGTGREEEHLKTLASELGIKDKVKFLGYIKEEELWDYLSACDVFAHPNWADFAIAPFEALALQKNVVWSTESEISGALVGNRHVFPAEPEIEDLARALEQALVTEVKEKYDMSQYTWENYFTAIVSEIIHGYAFSPALES